MADLKKQVQRGAGRTAGISHPEGGDEGENNHGARFGTHDRAERGKDGDLDRSGVSRNQGHGHPREERERGSE